MTQNAALGVLGLIGRSFRLFAANLGFLFPLAFVPALALSAVTYLAVDGGGADAGPQAVGGTAGLVVLLLNLMVGFVVTGVMCLARIDAALGKRHTVGEYLGQTMRHLGPIVVLGTLLSVATALGTFLVLLPGLYVAARFLPWAPAIVFENEGWGGLGRAQALTEGHRWPLVGGLLLLGVLVIGLLVVSGPILFTAAGAGVLSVLIEAVLTGLYYALIAVFSAVVYLRLREIRDGITPAEVAASIG
jgi:hypothetical protein